MTGPSTFAAWALECLASRIPPSPEKLKEWVEAAKLPWKHAKGLENLKFAAFPLNHIPDGVLNAAAEHEAVEYEILQVVGDVPLHYHKRTGGVVMILRNNVGPETKAYLRYGANAGDWHRIPNAGQKIEIPAETIHGFIHPANGSSLYILSINIPPLSPKDTVLTEP